MSGTKRGGNHAMKDVTTHRSSGVGGASQAALLEAQEMSYNELRARAADLGVFRVGMTKEELQIAVASH